MFRLTMAIFALTVALATPMHAQSQSLPSECDGSALDRNIAPNRVIASCTAVIDAGLTKGDNLSLAYFNRGTAYFAVKQFALALKDFDEATELRPSFASAYGQRGTTYAAMGQPERAIQDFDQAIKLAPNQAGGYANRGTAYAQLGQFQRAIEDYDQAIKLEPDDAVVFANRGNAYANLSQFDRAIQDYDEALKLKPDFAEIALTRCHALIDAGRTPDASCPASDPAQPKQ
jgi:tetratricopeptide (TPR) repeat protein